MNACDPLTAPHRRFRMALLLCAGLFLPGPGLGAQVDDPEVLLEAARYEEEIRGDLETAIRIYQSLVERHGGHRGIAARALLGLGGAFEALGRTEAREVYHRIVDEYADQRDAAEVARSRLAALPGPSPAAHAGETGYGLRLLWTTRDAIGAGGLSPDGRYAAFIDWGLTDDPALRGHADVALYDTREGRARLVTDRPSQNEVDVYPSSPVWSRDGAWIAYTLWAPEWTHQQLRLVRPDGTGDRVLLDNRQMADVRAMTFSSEGHFIVALLRGWDDSYRIGTIPTEGGSFTVLKTLGPHRPSTISLSPDDRFVAYDYPVPDASGTSDLLVLATDGSRERSVASHAAVDERPFWTPDGGRIVFQSDRSGQRALWMLDWRDGRPDGEPELLHLPLAGVELLGVTASGAPYFRAPRNRSEVYAAELNLTGAGSLGKPSRLPKTHLLTNLRPAWSPGGERVAYLSRRGPAGESPHLVVKTLSTGEETAHLLPFALQGRDSRPDWSLDGRHVWVEGRDTDGTRRGRVSYRVDVTTGEVIREPFRRDFAGMATGNGIAEFHFVDGRQARALRSLGIRIVGQTDARLFEEGDEPLRPGETLLWVRNGVQRIRSVAGWEVKPLTPVGHMGNWSLSPDGTTLALAIASDSVMVSNVLYVLPVTGGDPRELARVERTAGGDRHGSITAVRWSPDGESVIYAVERLDGDPRSTEIWRVALDGATPERLQLPLTAYELGNLRFHPDGRRIVYTVATDLQELWMAEGFPWQRSDRR